MEDADREIVGAVSGKSMDRMMCEQKSKKEKTMVTVKERILGSLYGMAAGGFARSSVFIYDAGLY